MSATKAKRQDLILQRLAVEREVRVEELAEQFAVNAITVRRDLAAMEGQGRVCRTHGGAISTRGATVEFAFRRQAQSHQAEKVAIAAAVRDRIAPGMTVSLDTGTTTLEVARSIASVGNLKVLTSSLAIASAHYLHENVEVILLGGVVRGASPDLFGMLTEENLQRFRVDVAILGADAASPEGAFTDDVRVARISQAMAAGGGGAILVVDSSKFRKTSFVRFAAWEDIDCVVTDDGLDAAQRAWLERQVARVVYASPAAGRPRAKEQAHDR